MEAAQQASAEVGTRPPSPFAAPEVALPASQRLDKARFDWSSIPLLLPAVVLLAVLFLGPVVYSFYLGLTNLTLIGPTSHHFSFTGTANLSRLIHDPVFPKSLYLTAIFVVGSGVVGATVLGLVLALAMQRAVRAVSGVVGIIVTVAFMLPPVTVALVWYATSTGTLPALVGSPQSDFLQSLPLVVVSAADTWSLTGLAMLLFAAALRNIPREVIEYAELENANAVQRLSKVVIPLLRPTIITTVLLMTLLALANFTVVYIMTAGGPGSASMILPVYSYQQAFSFDNLAYGALIGNVTVVLAGIFSFLYARLVRARAREAGGIT